jgi:hypothetical protein
MKRIIATLVMTCALSLSAFAGEIPTCGPTAVTGEVPTNGSPVAESSVLTELLLTLVGLLVR